MSTAGAADFAIKKPPQGRFFLWCRLRESNTRQHDYEFLALQYNHLIFLVFIPTIFIIIPYNI